MNLPFHPSRRAAPLLQAAPLLLAALVALLAAPLARADRDDHDNNRDRGARQEARGPDVRHDDRERFEQRRDRGDWGYRPYRSNAWRYDTRFHHNHYYPAPGYAVTALPPGFLNINIGNGRLFFSAGTWFRPEGRRYVVVTPPPGAYLPILPPDYSTVWIRGAPYYYANDVYYTSAPSGGYVVTAPPEEPAPPPVMATTPPPPPGSPPPPPPGVIAAGAEDGLIVYPRQGQSEALMARDRAECTAWAVNQTGYDPARSPPADPRRSDFQRAAGACLDAHGYTVK
jgi:hypothetical protein